jgi:hypothetical protein
VAKPREVGSPITAQADELAIERHPVPAKRVDHVGQLGKVGRALAAGARPQRH